MHATPFNDAIDFLRDITRLNFVISNDAQDLISNESLEVNLKLKEISYIHAEGYSAGEMKHGPIALIDENMPVVGIATKGPFFDKTFANLEEVRARNGKLIVLGSEGDPRIAAIADDVFIIPQNDPLIDPIVSVVPTQLLAYHIADIRGTDVDQPRNLAKSVTVE